MSEATHCIALEREPVQRPAKVSAPREVRLPYMPALDGLRALAAVVVLLYHADMPWMPGGFLGVEVFFVLSGYLITSLLLAEWRQSGRVNLIKFGLRRVRRLFPAMLLMTVASVAYVVLFLPGEVAGLRRDAVAGLGYVTNWYLIFSRTSYFESVGRPSILRHLWSLAIEGQLYIFWPLVFSLLVRRWRGRWVPIMALLGAVASATMMALLYQPEVDPSRVYYGTDTRSAGFLLGAVFAFRPTAGRRATGVVPWLYDVAGLASLGVLAWTCSAINAYEPLLYRGGLGIVAAATILIIAASVRTDTRVVPGLLGCRPLRWIGLRSYGIYLWHWPIFMLTRPQLDLPLEGIPLLALRFALTLILTEISYRCVEKPLHLGALGRARRAYSGTQGSRRTLVFRWGGAFLALAAAFVVLGRAVVSSQPSMPDWYVETGSVRIVLSSPPAEVPGQEAIATPTLASGVPTDPTPTAANSREPATTTQPSQAEARVITATVQPDNTLVPPSYVPFVNFDSSPSRALVDDEHAPMAYPQGSDSIVFQRSPDGTPAPTASPSPVEEGSVWMSVLATSDTLSATLSLSDTLMVATAAVTDTSNLSQPSTVALQDTLRVVAVGDSVMVSAANQLTETVDGLSIDAAIGRQMREVIEVLQDIRAAGQMGDVVVIQVGNNGYLSAKKFDEMMALLKDVRSVMILNCRVPRQWEETVNTVLAEGVQRYANATLIDWYAASADHPEFFWKDGMHLRPEGAKVYAELIAKQIDLFSP